MEKLRELMPENSSITVLEKLSGSDGMSDVCKVLFESRPTESSLIRCLLWMPDNWNGIFVGLGNGGIAGSLSSGFGDYARQGYAAAQTDMGTSLVRSGERTKADSELWKDYTWRSTHIMTEISKTLIKGYYGRYPDYSYFIGASAGGLQAFSEAQRYPEDYDGIIAGVPSNNALNLIVYFLWLQINLHEKDGSGIITKDQAKAISLCAAEFFGSRGDGENGDDFVTYPYTDENTVNDFIEFLRGKSELQLISRQLNILRKIYNGPKNKKTGEQIFCGLPIGAERNSGYFGDASNGGKFGYPWLRLFFGEDYDDWSFDFADDYDTILAEIGKDFTANNPELDRLRANGSKFLVYSGSADPAGPWADALKYCNRVCERLGGYEEVSKFFRFFILPGKAHGDTGLGVNKTWGDESRTSLLDTMRKWREKGTAPEYLTGAHIDIEDGNERIKFVRRIYPYKADKQEYTEFPKTSSDRILERT
nr:tannase/feruloyl esterase family alpha/beta hydrolase [Clostridia bacterium]